MTTFDTYNLTLLRSPLRSERDTESVKNSIKQKARKLQTRKSDRSALEWSKDLELIKTNKSERRAETGETGQYLNMRTGA